MDIFPKNNDDHPQVPVLPPPSRETGMMCSTCVRWERSIAHLHGDDTKPAIESTWGRCGLANHTTVLFTTGEDTVLTGEDFGCIHHRTAEPIAPPPSPEPVTPESGTSELVQMLESLRPAGTERWSRVHVLALDKIIELATAQAERLTQLTRITQQNDAAIARAYRRRDAAEAKVTALEAQLATSEANRADDKRRMRDIQIARDAAWTENQQLRAELSTLQAERAEQPFENVAGPALANIEVLVGAARLTEAIDRLQALREEAHRRNPLLAKPDHQRRQQHEGDSLE